MKEGRRNRGVNIIMAAMYIIAEHFCTAHSALFVQYTCTSSKHTLFYITTMAVASGPASFNDRFHACACAGDQTAYCSGYM